MSEFTLAPPQSAETIAGFRDGQPWLVLPPTVVREWRAWTPKGWTEWLPGMAPETGLVRTDRTRMVPVQVPDPVPCPDNRCVAGGPQLGRPTVWPNCPRCNGSGSMQRPLLVPTWQCDGCAPYTFGPSLHSADFCATFHHERRLAGVVLHPNPVYLPVLGFEESDHDILNDPHVQLYTDGLICSFPPGRDITDQFSTPPPVGARLVDMSDAVWLEGDDVVTEMWVPLSERTDDEPFSCYGSLSASTALTTIEVP